MIELAFHARQEPPPEEGNLDKWRQQNKELLLGELVRILERSGKTGNMSKLLTDFINRERKASTAIGSGIAVPHVRTMQARDLIIGFARSRDGYDFDAPDKKLTHLFFIMAAPPYDDSLYLRVFKSLSEVLRYDTFREALMQASEPFDIIKAFKMAE